MVRADLMVIACRRGKSHSESKSSPEDRGATAYGRLIKHSRGQIAHNSQVTQVAAIILKYQQKKAKSKRLFELESQGAVWLL